MNKMESELTFRSLSRTNRVRCEASEGFNHPLNSWSGSDWMVAALGELGEASNIMKKMNRVRDGLPGNKANEDNNLVLQVKLQDEIADTVIYLDLLAQRYGFDLGEAVRTKFNMKSADIGAPHRL